MTLNPKSEILISNPTGIALPIPIKEGAKQIPILQFSKFQTEVWNLGFRNCLACLPSGRDLVFGI